MEPDMGMDAQLLDGTGLEPPPQFKEEPPESWQVCHIYYTYTYSRLFPMNICIKVSE